ncbi:MAG: OmpA family protein [Kofleriaceae bacterium]
MASIMALRAIVVAGVGLGALDLVWINAALGPKALEGDAPAATSGATIAATAEPAGSAKVDVDVEGRGGGEGSGGEAPGQASDVADRTAGGATSADARGSTAGGDPPVPSIAAAGSQRPAGADDPPAAPSIAAAGSQRPAGAGDPPAAPSIAAAGSQRPAGADDRPAAPSIATTGSRRPGGTDDPPAAPSIASSTRGTAATTEPPTSGRGAPRASKPAASVDERVYFATRSTALDQAAHEIIARVAEEAGARAIVMLEGHADERGAEPFNLSLSKRRAIVVSNQLRRLGVPRARIRVRYVGEGRATGGGELWRDRRVDIQIMGGP